ncbi:transporter substrate-binding domain-containing protein [Kaistia granuli]|uniref:transporter substrate-binding domain-containing protein n=1 Tax=Kaistia granuli TaxID=363259 RepID=UPI00037228FD|nr:transporter substrate-binding domain-containing protein [Kaistia granuli]
MKFLTKMALAATIALGAAGVAKADVLADIKAKGEIAIAIDLGAPPWGMTDANLKPAGADVDVANKLAADLGVKMKLVEVTGPNRVPFLLTNKTDIVISSFAITPERAKVVDFVPYSVNRLIVFGPKGVEIKSLEDLAGKRVGVVRGNLQDTELTKKAPADTKLVRFDDDATTITALMSGQVDAMCAPYGMYLTLAERYPAKELEPKAEVVQQPLGIGLRQNEPEMKAWLQDWVKKGAADGSLSTIFEKYMGAKLDLAPFLAEAK